MLVLLLLHFPLFFLLPLLLLLLKGAVRVIRCLGIPLIFAVGMLPQFCAPAAADADVAADAAPQQLLTLLQLLLLLQFVLL